MLSGIRDNLVRPENVAMTTPGLEKKMARKFSTAPLTKEGIFHESAGWKTLETSAMALLELCKACGSAFASSVDEELLNLLLDSIPHPNRFVRETAYYVCAELSDLVHSKDGTPGLSRDVFDDSMCDVLATGMSDNWSQVRMASSVATRRFLLGIPEEVRNERYYPTLIPRMVLNRYYVAEGVRLYSQQSWKIIAGDSGKALVEANIGNVVKFYTEQADAS